MDKTTVLALAGCAGLGIAGYMLWDQRKEKLYRITISGRLSDEKNALVSAEEMVARCEVSIQQQRERQQTDLTMPSAFRTHGHFVQFMEGMIQKYSKIQRAEADQFHAAPRTCLRFQWNGETVAAFWAA